MSRRLFIILFYIFIHRPVSGASAVVLTFFIHSESVPRGRTIYLILVNVVHTYGYTEHRTHCYKVRAYMSVRYSAVVRAPIIHHVVSGLERPLASNARREPSARPSIVGTFPQFIGNFVGKANRPALYYLQHGT